MHGNLLTNTMVATPNCFDLFQLCSAREFGTAVCPKLPGSAVLKSLKTDWLNMK